MSDYSRKATDPAATLAECEIILDAYNHALGALNGALTLINESNSETAMLCFNELTEAMRHLGHAYSVMIQELSEETT